MTFVNYQYADQAAAAIQDFLRKPEGRELPQAIQDKAWELIRPGGSLSFAVAYFAELIFARKEEVSNAALQLAASCAQVANLHNIDNMGGRRGVGIMMALRRRSGEKAPVGMSWPKAEDDPTPRAQFLSDEKKAEAGIEEAVPSTSPVAGPVSQPLEMPTSVGGTATGE
jgi:hypothetical protein